MSTKDLALILLVGHITSAILIAMVLKKQLRILRGRPDTTLRHARQILSGLALTVLIGNFVPLTIDSLVLMNKVSRNHPTPVGVAYATSNVIILVLSAASVLALYIAAERLVPTTER